MTTNTGGPAFPLPRTWANPYLHGMTLRDYFAAKAMQGMLASCDLGNEADLSKRAYEYADAVLKQREKP